MTSFVRTFLACSGLGLILAGLSFSFGLAPAQAHHLMELMGMPVNPLSGVLSGLAHPVIGPDHLLFLRALALVGLRSRRRWMLALLCTGLAGSALAAAPAPNGVNGNRSRCADPYTRTQERPSSVRFLRGRNPGLPGVECSTQPASPPSRSADPISQRGAAKAPLLSRAATAANPVTRP